MKTAIFEKTGGPEVMQIVDVPVPEIGPKQVLIRVEAGGLNYSDILIREGRYVDRMEMPYRPGRECVGRIEAVGERVKRWEVGQRVLASVSSGAFAEYVAVHSVALVPCPDDLDAEAAVALLVQGITALHCLVDVGGLQEGETVLIHAAAGGVGSLAVQIAKAYGAQVIGTASSPEKCQVIMDMGARAVNYSEGDWAQAVLDLTDGRGADLILESVGGEVFERSFREVLRDMGRLVTYGIAGGQLARVSNAELLVSGKAVIGYFLPAFVKRWPGAMAKGVRQLAEMVQTGQIGVLMGGSFTLDEIREAYDHMQGRESVGKIVIRP